MKITVTTQEMETVSAQALVVLHEKAGMLAETKNAELRKHMNTFARDVEAKVCKREWFCTLEKSAKAKTGHMLLDSVTFHESAPHDEALKTAAARCISLCREYSLSKLVFVVDHKLAALKAAAILEGIMLGDFKDERFKGNKQKGTKRAELEITFVVARNAEKAVKESLRVRQVICEAQNNARLLVNAPHHVLTPDALAKYAQALAKKHNMRCSVLNEKQLLAKGYLPTWHVGRGSEYPPRMVVLEYSPPKPKIREHIALVGKGMTFDSGGLCIKGRDMYKMNGDMGGSATVLGAMEAIARLKLPVKITAIIASAHNAVDGSAYYPGCIITAKNGKTIHVENTDAEGRLVLSDCFHKAGEVKADVMWDFATLTGACPAALGPAIAGLFTDDEDLRVILMEAGANTGDDVWPLPLVKEYESFIKHSLADLNNMSNEPRGGAIHAANFLKQFVPQGIRWAHLDVAGVATVEKPRRYLKPGGSGFGVRLIVEALRLWETRGK